jgi:translation initiation factor 3 subunit C
MSRFFRGSSDSESESDYESSVVSSSEESEESEEEIQEQKVQRPAGAMRFMKGAQGDSSESESEVETGTRVVKSAKDKVYDDMRGIVRSMKNSKKISNWAAVMNEFDRLQKVVAKSTAMFVNEGGIPRFYVRTLIQLDEQVRESLANKDALKKMKATTAKALTALKQKIRKTIQQYADQIEKFKQNPVTEEESADERTKAMDSDDMFDEDSESEEEGVSGRSKWTKSESKKTETPKQVTFEEPEDDDGFVVVGKGGKPLEISQENVFKALADLNEVRGKKGTDKSTLTQSLRKVLNLAKNPYQKARVLLALIPALFDTVASSSSMSPLLWREIADDFNALMDILEENETIIVSANASEIEEDLEHEQVFFVSSFDIFSNTKMANLFTFWEILVPTLRNWIKSFCVLYKTLMPIPLIISTGSRTKRNFIL